MADDFDPDAYLSELAVSRAKGIPAQPGTPPGIAAPDTTKNAAQLPDYAHDPVPPGKTADVRAAITQLTASPGFDNLPPDEQRKQIIDAVHGVTRQDDGPATPGFLGTLVHSAGKAVPFGHQTGAALASMPVIGNGRTYRDNYDALERDTAAGVAAHPVAGVLGTTAGIGATIAASGGLGGGAAAPALAPTVGQATARAAAPLAVNTLAGGAQGAADAASEGRDASEVGSRALAGATSGAALSTLVPAASQAIGKIFSGAIKRSDERMLSDAGDVATKKMRDKINEKADETVALLLRKPDVRGALTTPAHLVAATEDHLTTNGVRLNKIYDAADKIHGTIDGGRLAAAVGDVQKRLGGRLATKEIAAALDPTISKLADESGRGISGAEIREEISRLQGIAFDRSITAPPTSARAAAGLAAGKLKDLLEDHVQEASRTARAAAEHAAGPGTPGLVPTGAIGAPGARPGGLSPAQLHQIADELDMSTVRSLNSDQTVLMRLKKAAEYRANAAPNQQGTRLSKIAAGVVTHGSHAVGAGEIVHGLATGDMAGVAKGVATAVAPHVIPPAVRGIDEGISNVGRATADVRAAHAPGVERLSQKLVGINNHGAATQALMEHVFGEGPKDPADAEPFPEFGGPAGAEGEGGDAFKF